ncbi:hypothetical protein [Legionella sp. WA2024007413]
MNHLKSQAEKIEFAKARINKYRTENSFIHPSVSIPEHVIIGKNVIIHEHCTLGTDGLYVIADENGDLITMPHIGKLIIEDNVEIQACTNISRGFTGDTIIGKGTKIAAHCHIAHEVKIGKNCIICAQVVVCGFVSISDRVWIGPNSCLKELIKIGEHAFIGMSSNVIRDVEPAHVIAGNPAKILRNSKPSHLEHIFGEKY